MEYSSFSFINFWLLTFWPVLALAAFIPYLIILKKQGKKLPKQYILIVIGALVIYLLLVLTLGDNFQPKNDTALSA